MFDCHSNSTKFSVEFPAALVQFIERKFTGIVASSYTILRLCFIVKYVAAITLSLYIESIFIQLLADVFCHFLIFNFSLFKFNRHSLKSNSFVHIMPSFLPEAMSGFIICLILIWKLHLQIFHAFFPSSPQYILHAEDS